MQIYNLIVETTRRCNMKCGHCLRGKPQNKTICDEHMYNLLRQVDYISNVTFSGGEPTLPSSMKAIERFMEICNELGVSVGSFYIATNAKVWRDELPELINKLYNFCEDNEISGIAISNDMFHENNGFHNQDFRMKLEEILQWEYGLEDLVHWKGQIDYEFVISQGNAKNWGTKENTEEEIIWCEYDDEICISEGNIYLNCDGQIIAGCDWSYLEQPEHKICDANGDLEEAVKKIGTEDKY